MTLATASALLFDWLTPGTAAALVTGAVAAAVWFFAFRETVARPPASSSRPESGSLSGVDSRQPGWLLEAAEAIVAASTPAPNFVPAPMIGGLSTRRRASAPAETDDVAAVERTVPREETSTRVQMPDWARPAGPARLVRPPRLVLESQQQAWAAAEAAITPGVTLRLMGEIGDAPVSRTVPETAVPPQPPESAPIPPAARPVPQRANRQFLSGDGPTSGLTDLPAR